MMTSVIGWIVLGMVVGFLASKLVNRRGEGLLLDIALGIAGAAGAGWLFRPAATPAATGFDAWSVVVAIVGAALLLSTWHLIRGPARQA
jgi:uncharacterized membrane protein YeaQ/YmgE (transglycosylase-associated protein family)